MTDPGHSAADQKLLETFVGAEFLPCPFCSGTAIDVVEGTTSRWRVAECAECGARGPEERWIYTDPDPDASARARVVTSWNTRA